MKITKSKVKKLKDGQIDFEKGRDSWEDIGTKRKRKKVRIRDISIFEGDNQ